MECNAIHAYKPMRLGLFCGSRGVRKCQKQLFSPRFKIYYIWSYCRNQNILLSHAGHRLYVNSKNIKDPICFEILLTVMVRTPARRLDYRRVKGKERLVPRVCYSVVLQTLTWRFTNSYSEYSLESNCLDSLERERLSKRQRTHSARCMYSTTSNR